MQHGNSEDKTSAAQLRGQRRLEREIGRSQLALLAERAARAFWPLASLLLLAGAFIAFGGLAVLGPNLALVSLLGAALLTGFLLQSGARRFRLPSRREGAARLDARLPGRPLAALADNQAIGREDAGSASVWARHLERMAETAASARAAVPDLRLAGRDPWGLRLVALVAALAAILFARSAEQISLQDLMGQDQGASVAAGPSFEVWAAPPAYTGKPTIYLNESEAGELDLPEGSEITLRVYGAAEAYALEQSIAPGAEGLADMAEGISGAVFAVQRSGRFSLQSGEARLGEWDVLMIPDKAPEIELTEELTRSVSGEMELNFEARDDYGVISGEVEITLDMADLDRRYGLAAAPEPREKILLDLPMPLSGSGEEIRDVLVEDLSKHPWVGLPVTLTLRARDAAGQEGSAEGLTAVLPGRRFFDPVAQAVLEQRRDLLWSIENQARVDQMLRVITHAPEDVFTNRTAYLMTRMALRRMGYMSEDGFSPEERDEIAELLWNVALTIEDGSLSDARERLRQAQERLRDALRNGATEDEIAELMQELREAMDNYMRQLAEEAIARGEQPPQQQQSGQDQMSITQDQLQELMDRIQELAEQGETEQAEALLRQLQELMENLQMQMTQGGQGQQGGEGQQMMQELQDTLRQQQDLADDSFQQLQREFQNNRQNQQGQNQQGQQQQGQQQGGQQQGGQQQGGQQPGGQQQPGQQGGQQGGQQPGQQPGGQQEGQSLTPGELSRRQEALRGMLDDLRGRLPGPSTEEGQDARRALEDAERNMGEARDNLEEGDLSGALDRQADAIDALREGLRGLGEEMQQQAQESQGQQGQEMGEGFDRNNQDPLGRPSASRGSARDGSTVLPEEEALRRAQELFDEIRRRASERERPVQELDYLRRLLDRF